MKEFEHTTSGVVEYFAGSLRITNPKTLKKWLDNGDFQKMIDQGYQFNVGCGRFRLEKCTCYKCRTKKRLHMQELIKHYR